MRIIIIILICLICKIAINFYYLQRIKQLQNLYIEYWSNKDRNNCPQYISEIKDLFQKANVNDKQIGYTQPLGFNQIQTGNASVIENMFVNNKRIVASALDLFDETLGTYKRRILETFNPVYWIEFILFLPRNIVKYLGFNEDTVFTRFFQLLYWIFSAIYAIYSEQINKIIQDFLSNFFK